MINIKYIVSAVPKNFLSEEAIINSVGKDSYKKIKNYTGFEKIHRLKSHQNSESLINYTIDKFFKLPLKSENVFFDSSDKIRKIKKI